MAQLVAPFLLQQGGSYVLDVLYYIAYFIGILCDRSRKWRLKLFTDKILKIVIVRCICTLPSLTTKHSSQKTKEFVLLLEVTRTESVPPKKFHSSQELLESFSWSLLLQLLLVLTYTLQISDQSSNNCGIPKKRRVLPRTLSRTSCKTSQTGSKYRML